MGHTPTTEATSEPKASSEPAGPNELESIPGLVGHRLTLTAFHQLAGTLAGYPFVKIVVDRPNLTLHVINSHRYAFHADYIAENLLGKTVQELEREIDDFNRSVYLNPARRFYVGLVSLHRRGERQFFSLETVEIDNMDEEMILFFFDFVRAQLDPSVPILFKPANHLQEALVSKIDPVALPRIYNRDIFASATYVALNPGEATGRLRLFQNEAEYRRAFPTLEWYDIIVMPRVPDDIPRVSGILNDQHTTPLSHTNVLAAGWQIPNAIELGILDRLVHEDLDMQWVTYRIENNATAVHIAKTSRPSEISTRPAWSVHRIKLEEPEIARAPICDLGRLRMTDRFRYGTKAANLGELRYLLENGSQRLLGFYRVPRPPRPGLLGYLAERLGVPERADLEPAAWDFLKATITVPRGIAIPFTIQEQFLVSSPRIQQAIGKLKMALELNAKEIDPLCLNLQHLIRQTRIPDPLRDYIDRQIAGNLAGVSSFVVRSSANAEDLENFSAAGIYESINHVASAERIFDSIKEVWASLVSPRSVRLQNEVGISLDDVYMGVIIQEEVHADMGGVMVTTNPMNTAGDFRNVYLNVSLKSVTNVVDGSELPHQYLFNTVEGGGQTLSLGSSEEDLSPANKASLQRLALAGRLLQSHFCPDYTFSAPLDIEWVASEHAIYILQLRPYAG